MVGGLWGSGTHPGVGEHGEAGSGEVGVESDSRRRLPFFKGEENGGWGRICVRGC